MAALKFSSILSIFTFLLTYAGLATIVSSTDYTVVNMRIEGSNATLFQGPILTTIHTVTTPSGGTHKCDGTNFNAYSYPVLTATGALDDASKYARFKLDGTWYSSFDDFLITTIGSESESGSGYWALYINGQLAPRGGCQSRVELNDNVLWAYILPGDFGTLQLTGPRSVVAGSEVTYKVVNASNNLPVANATVLGLSTNQNGEVSYYWNASTSGIFPVRASKIGTTSSNILETYLVPAESRRLELIAQDHES